MAADPDLPPRVNRGFALIALLAGAAQAEAPLPVRVFIASDSTAQDYGPDRYPQSGWGTMLRCAFGPGVTVDNRAIAARSSRSFIDEGRLDDIARDIRPGDTLLIQFGHNDANRAKPERYASVADYRAYLRRYIDVARNAGAQPVLLTPVTLRHFEGAAVTSGFPDYSAAVRELAAATATPLIDLDMLSGRWVERAGPEASKRYYVGDDVHFSELGARGVAEIVAGALAELQVPVSARVLAARPALTFAAPTGGASCATPNAMSPQTFHPGADGTLSIPVPEGNYRVTVTFGDRRAASETNVEAEAHRLMLANIRTKRGEFVTRSFVVNIRDAHLAEPPANGPGGSEVRLNPGERGSADWDDRLSLAFTGPAPRVASVTIEPATVPTIFLFGDSTVTDRRTPPDASWGAMLPLFVGPDAAVSNHAESGETLKSFLAELRLDKALSLMKPGDFALIQFGHNDQKFTWPQTYVAAATTYRAYLRAYIAEVRMHGGTPVLVTSPERRIFTQSGKVRPMLQDYAAAMRAVAEEEKVALVDLNAASIRILETLGPEASSHIFADGDRTHHNRLGAVLLASRVADGIREASGPLAKLLASEGMAVSFDARDDNGGSRSGTGRKK